jgi:hypothetical protein
MKYRIFLYLILLFIWSGSIAQSRIGVWHSHLPYSNASEILLAGNKVYCVTDGGLFYFNKSDNSIEKLSKENGLSDTEISALGYSDEFGITVIAYMDANIDLIQNNTVYNIPDIMRYNQLLGDKRIYSILIKDKSAYLCSGFGIVVLNLESKEITETYKIGEGGAQIKVNALCYDAQYFYAATDQGIYMAEINAPNLQDYNYWNRVVDISNYNLKFNAIIKIGNRIYTSHKTDSPIGDMIYFSDGVSWERYTPFQDDDVNYFSEWDGNLVVSCRYHVKVISSDGLLLAQYLINSPKCTFIDQSSVLWTADSEKGLVKKNADEDSLITISPNGPSTLFVSQIAVSNNVLYTVPGGASTSNNNLFRNGEVSTFKDNKWTNFKKTQYKDFYRIAIDPLDPEHYFVGSWGYGLFEFQKDSIIKIYREDNSSLQTIIPGDFYRLGGLTYDNDGNLWVTNSSVPEPLSVLKKADGEWKSFSMNNLLNGTINTGNIIVTQSGYKWMILTSHSRGLLVMDDNGTIEDSDDDQYKHLDIKDINNAIITNDVYSIAEDHDGNIWLGTNKGVLVYYNPSGVFAGENFYADYIRVPRIDEPGLADFLLYTESVTAIAVDGANRKWLGTKNAGVFLVSDDGLKQIHNFTAENSPLLSNSITSIAINEKSGEVFFGTDKGIISYTADATGPAENFNSVFVFPNPVRENFTGEISITGLLENSMIKVTDLNGNLVFETISLGGQVLWDGRNFRREKVGTGVYLVFCSSEDGTLSHVTKLLFIH